jgi:phosphoglycolate phosphatase
MATLLIDLDGTLTDPELGITSCIEHAVQSLGHVAPPREELRQYIGPPLHRSLATVLDSDDPALIQLALTRYRERFATVGLFENSLYPFVPAGLAALRKAQHRLFVATSKPTVYASRIVDHFDLTRYFERVYGSELTGERTDKADLIAFILDKEGLDPRTTWMIGDRSHDIIGGARNGLRTIGVRWGFGSDAEFVEAKAHFVVDDMAQILGHVGAA